MLARQLRMLDVNRARVRLFFRHTNFRQVIDQDFGLDLELPGQLIDADLIGIAHSPLSDSNLYSGASCFSAPTSEAGS